MQQPQTFSHLVPDIAELPEEHQTGDSFFELAWQPPCLYLRKPTHATPLLVNSALVRQLTYVLLHNVEIGLCDPDTGNPCLSFRTLRDAAARQAIHVGDRSRPSAQQVANFSLAAEVLR